jgi:membrane-bound ClpP family serine protease
MNPALSILFVLIGFTLIGYSFILGLADNFILGAVFLILGAILVTNFGNRLL